MRMARAGWMQGGFLLMAMMFGNAALAETEYDMYRAPSVPSETMVVLDLSMKMGCSPAQMPPPAGEVACGYDVSGMPPYFPDKDQQARSRLGMVKQAFAEYARQSPDAFQNTGLATYGNGGGVVRVPVTFRENADAAGLLHTDLLQALETLQAGEEPSLLGSLLEVGQYFSGQAVLFGRYRSAYREESHAESILTENYQGFLPRSRTQTVSHPAAVVNGNHWLMRESACTNDIALRGPRALLETYCASEHYNDAATAQLRYRAPAGNTCSAREVEPAEIPERHLLLMASQSTAEAESLDRLIDGVPLGVWVNRLVTDNQTTTETHPSCRVSSGEGKASAWQSCALALVDYLHHVQRLNVSVVTLGDDSESLARISATGGGRYFSVDNVEALRGVLDVVLSASVPVANPPISPLISNYFTTQTLEGDTRLVTTQFQPLASGQWPGNVKRYAASVDNHQLVLSAEQGGSTLLANCGDAQATCLHSSARSAWTQSSRPDGNIVTRGGAADTLPPVPQRAAFVQLGRTQVPLQTAASVAAMTLDQRQVLEFIAHAYGWQGSSVLQDAQYPLVEKALARYNQFAGVDPGNAEFQRLSTLGIEPWQHRSGESNTLGASVFGAPLLVSYDIAAAQDSAQPGLQVLWWSGTDGFLRAMDAETGEWLSSTLPESVIPALMAEEALGTGEVIAGLDTSWVALRHDHNKDGMIRRTDGDYVYLYGGLRRAGRRVLAFDVTDPEVPQTLFDLGADSAGFSALAQAWSTPVLAKLKLPGHRAAQTVLVFGGGYDGRFDANHGYAPCNASPGVCGAAIYIVQATGAEAGRLLWSIDSLSGQQEHTQVDAMVSPIAAPVKSVDIDGDGITDTLFALDIDGKLFQIQLPSATDDNASLQVRLLAALSFNAPERDNAFLLAPSVALQQSAVGQQEWVIAVGSGRLPQPHSSQGQGGLFVVRAPLVAQGDRQAEVEPMIMAAGEKLMAPPLILDHQAYFLSWAPAASQAERCAVSTGRQRLWAVDTRPANPQQDNTGQLDPAGSDDTTGALQSPLTTRLSPLLLNGDMFLMQGENPASLGRYPAQSERMRWQQVMVGPQVRRQR